MMTNKDTIFAALDNMKGQTHNQKAETLQRLFPSLSIAAACNYASRHRTQEKKDEGDVYEPAPAKTRLWQRPIPVDYFNVMLALYLNKPDSKANDYLDELKAKYERLTPFTAKGYAKIFRSRIVNGVL